MQREYLIRLPWPPKELTPNFKRSKHWSRYQPQIKAYRTLARDKGLEHGLHKDKDPKAVLTFEFYPPCYRHRDLHNMPETMKAGIDGLADSMGTDDHQFKVIWPEEFKEKIKGGGVLVHVRGQEEVDNWQPIGSLAEKMVRGVVT